MSENKIQVFLSRPNPFTQHQSFFIKEFTKLLKQSGFECVTLQAAEYSPYEVMTGNDTKKLWYYCFSIWSNIY